MSASVFINKEAIPVYRSPSFSNPFLISASLHSIASCVLMSLHAWWSRRSTSEEDSVSFSRLEKCFSTNQSWKCPYKSSLYSRFTAQSNCSSLYVLHAGTNSRVILFSFSNFNNWYGQRKGQRTTVNWIQQSLTT